MTKEEIEGQVEPEVKTRKKKKKKVNSLYTGFIIIKAALLIQKKISAKKIITVRTYKKRYTLCR